jgi:hypothetical protein
MALVRKRTIPTERLPHIGKVSANFYRSNVSRKRKNDQTRLFKLKYELLKISTNLRTEFAAETHLAVGQWL